MITLLLVLALLQGDVKRPVDAAAAKHFEKSEFTLKDGDKLTYWLMKPANVA